MVRTRLFCVATFALCIVSARSSLTGQQTSWVPDSTYDPSVPTIRQVLGFEAPERFTSFYETEKLLHAWADAVPERCRLIRYGEDYEGKGLYLLVISSPG
ncbi:MAG: hypothetical protein ACRD1T_21980, partial [Acidimicrobiia bacterium]